MRLFLIVLLLLTESAVNAASLLVIPLEQPSGSQSLETLYNLAINFQTGSSPTVISSIDIAFGTVPEGLSASLVQAGVFNPLNPQGTVVGADSIIASGIFGGGLSIAFPDTLISAHSFYSVLLSFSIFTEPPGSYMIGSLVNALDEGSSFHSVIVSDLLGNPNSLSTAPAIAVSGYAIPEPSPAGCIAISALAAAAYRRRTS